MSPTLPAEDYQALINQGVKPEDIILNMEDETDAESDVSMNDSGCNTMALGGNDFAFPDETTTARLLAVNTASKNLKRQHSGMACSATLLASSNLNNAANTVDNETELTEFIDFNEASTGPSAFITAAGYSPRLFYGSSSSSSAGCAIAASASTATASTTSPPPTSPSSLALPISGNGAQHKSVIVSPQSQRLADVDATKLEVNLTNIEQQPGDSGLGSSSNQRNANEDKQESVGGSNTEDVNSLLAISSHETKKARRVQKTARCITNSSGKRK